MITTPEKKRKVVAVVVEPKAKAKTETVSASKAGGDMFSCMVSLFSFDKQPSSVDFPVQGGHVTVEFTKLDFGAFKINSPLLECMHDLVGFSKHEPIDADNVFKCYWEKHASDSTYLQDFEGMKSCWLQPCPPAWAGDRFSFGCVVCFPLAFSQPTPKSAGVNGQLQCANVPKCSSIQKHQDSQQHRDALVWCLRREESDGVSLRRDSGPLVGMFHWRGNVPQPNDLVQALPACRAKVSYRASAKRMMSQDFVSPKPCELQRRQKHFALLLLKSCHCFAATQRKRRLGFLMGCREIMVTFDAATNTWQCFGEPQICIHWKVEMESLD